MPTSATQIQQVIAIKPGYLRIKRLLDILFTVLILLPLGLLTLIVAICIRMDSKGAIFFRQKRLGLYGKEFYLYKFRSMYEDSDDRVHQQDIERYMNGQVVSSENKGGLVYKRANDPRVTRVGRFLRKSSIDELPQFINVLKGEMSLVGPRPPLPYEVERYSTYQRLRLSGKPGLTGLWQVYGRSRVPFQKMVEMDIAYLRRQSIWEDVKLIVLTVLVMVQGMGGA
jgi:lipopolysaccharide/colanic/teichoic acid biosynthesis glycosyltransferase